MTGHPTTAPRPARSGGIATLGPGWTTFLVIDVVLVLTFLVLLAMQVVNTPSSPTAGPAVTGSGSPEPETTPEQSAPGQPDENTVLAEFVLPSGNVWCSMTETSATCTILQFSYERPATPEGCAGAVGNQLSVTADGPATFPCVEGDPPGPAQGLPVLEYGQASTIGEMTCFSSTNGATCRHNPSGNGFSVARAGYQIL